MTVRELIIQLLSEPMDNEVTVRCGDKTIIIDGIASVIVSDGETALEPDKKLTVENSK